MNKYRDRPTCIKCGNTRAQSLYIDDRQYDANIIKWIKRTCTNCGYTWPELPIDHIEEAKE